MGERKMKKLSEELELWKEFPFNENIDIKYVSEGIKDLAREWIKELENKIKFLQTNEKYDNKIKTSIIEKTINETTIKISKNIEIECIMAQIVFIKEFILEEEV